MLSYLARFTWPLPAVLVWGLAWGGAALLPYLGVSAWLATASACLMGVAASVLGATWWRRTMIGMGYPVSWLLANTASLPGWAWLLPLLALLLIYPLNAWRDAPLFPTPSDALLGLARAAPLPLLPSSSSSVHILDAGCGLGDGLIALHGAYPDALLHGLEWSWPLRILSALRCPWAQVRQGDIWQADWSTYQMVYVFQRPESMGRAANKALSDLRPGAWLVSLEFEAEQLQAHAVLPTPDGRPLWIYQIIN